MLVRNHGLKSTIPSLKIVITQPTMSADLDTRPLPSKMGTRAKDAELFDQTAKAKTLELTVLHVAYSLDSGKIRNMSLRAAVLPS